MSFEISFLAGSPFRVICLLGVWHSLIFVLASATQLRGHARWFLGGAFAILAYQQVVLSLLGANPKASLPFWIPLLSSSTGMAVGPCFYLGIRSLLFPNSPTKWTDPLHFVPAIIQLLVQFPVYVAGPLRSDLFERYLSIGLADSFIPGAEVPRLVALFYLVLIVRCVWKRRRRSDDWGPRTRLGYGIAATYGALSVSMIPIFSADPYAWIRPVSMCIVLMGLMIGVVTSLVPFLQLSGRRDRAVAQTRLVGDGAAPKSSKQAGGTQSGENRLPALMTIAISDSRIAPISEQEAAGASPSTRKEESSDATGEDPQKNQTVKYETSGLTDKRKERLRQQIVEHMEEEKPYLDPELSLSRMAKQVGLPPRYLSQIVNEMIGQSFTNWVNTYRIEVAKNLLRDPSRQHLTVVAVAREAGFNSKSAFYSAFTEHADTTPAAFRKEQPSISSAGE